VHFYEVVLFMKNHSS